MITESSEFHTSANTSATDNRYRRLLESAPDGIIEVDGHGRIVLLNSQAEKLFGYKREELLGKTVELLIPKRFHGRHPGHRENYRAHSVIRPMGSGLDLRALRADGTEFAVDINLRPFHGENGPGVICVIRDVTDRKAAEEQNKILNQSLEQRTRDLAVTNTVLQMRNREAEKANRLKSNFLATMSHELRTPLNSIQLNEVFHYPTNKMIAGGMPKVDLLPDDLHVLIAADEVAPVVAHALNLEKSRRAQAELEVKRARLRLLRELTNSLAGNQGWKRNMNSSYREGIMTGKRRAFAIWRACRAAHWRASARPAGQAGGPTCEANCSESVSKVGPVSQTRGRSRFRLGIVKK